MAPQDRSASREKKSDGDESPTEAPSDSNTRRTPSGFIPSDMTDDEMEEEKAQFTWMTVPGFVSYNQRNEYRGTIPEAPHSMPPLFLNPRGFRPDEHRGIIRPQKMGTALTFCNNASGEILKIWTYWPPEVFTGPDALMNFSKFYDEIEPWLMGGRPDEPEGTWPLRKMQGRGEHNEMPSQPPMCGRLEVVLHDTGFPARRSAPLFQGCDHKIFDPLFLSDVFPDFKRAFEDGTPVRVLFVPRGHIELMEGGPVHILKRTADGSWDDFGNRACKNNCGRRATNHSHDTCCGECGKDPKEWSTTTGHTPLCDRKNNVWSGGSHWCRYCDRLTRDTWKQCCRLCVDNRHTWSCSRHQERCDQIWSNVRCMLC